MDEKLDCLNDLDKVRHIEGFPLGMDEDICALSDPPYYTAYPNPHLADFITQHGTPYDESTDEYHREPFVSDVSVGKRDPIYGSHAYHTKVPYRAIMPFVEHYTQPGEIVFDGFCGTGMTGVASQLAQRKAILCDLAPAATFIARNYNNQINAKSFSFQEKTLLEKIRDQCGWMYETKHIDGSKGRIAFTVWSDVFSCPYCNESLVYWDIAVDINEGKVYTDFLCPHCNAQISKRELSYATEHIYDPVLQKHVKCNVQVPVYIEYTVGKNRYEKRPDKEDIELIQKINKMEIPYWFPSYPMMFKGEGWGDQWRAGYHTGITHSHQFYTRRNLRALATIWVMLPQDEQLFWRHAFTGTIQGLSKLQRYRPKSTFPNMILSGTLYIGSITREWNAIDWFEGKLKGLKRSFPKRTGLSRKNVAITTQSASQVQLPDNSIDYIFTDPPFGDNLAYSELNFLWEAWLQTFTNNKEEAIISKSQQKTLDDYRGMMQRSFANMYRILKPGHWITVVFHNSRANVWNAIQDALGRAGFLIAQVTAMDKKQESFNQVTAATAVKNDLIISAYKPRAEFSNSFLIKAGAGMERAFIKQHLGYLPVAVNVERTREMLYSKMLAYYIQRGYEISLNSAQFYRLLTTEFVERDGYWFRDEAQAQEYEQRKLDPARRKAAGKGQGVLFVTDERSAIAWLHHFLAAGPQTYSDLYTAYAKALQTSDDQIPELKQLLEETCVQVNGHWKRPDALTAEELETRRRERLLRQFNEYLREAAAGQKLTDVRKEAILTGFEEAYRTKHYQDIITVGGKLNQSLVDSSTEIFDFIDIAEAKVE